MNKPLTYVLFLPGECSIFPQSGISMITTFNITCKNWTDPDLPIKYDYSYELNGVRTVFFTRTGSPRKTVIFSGDLPIGDPNQDNVLDIFVNIRDKFDGATELHFTVKVVKFNV